MALFEDVFVGWGSGALVGVGAVVAAPIVLPRVGALLRPVAKGLIKGYFAVTDAVGIGFVIHGMKCRAKPSAPPVGVLAIDSTRFFPGRPGLSAEQAPQGKRGWLAKTLLNV